jgi:hypothetical protein
MHVTKERMERVELLNLRQSLDALGAQNLANALAVFHDMDALEIGFELAPRRSHREAAVVAKHGLLTAICTDRHQIASMTTPLRIEWEHATTKEFLTQGRLKGRSAAVYDET